MAVDFLGMLMALQQAQPALWVPQSSGYTGLQSISILSGTTDRGYQNR